MSFAHSVLRDQLWDILQHGKGQLGRLFSLILICLIILSIAILPLELIDFFSEYHETLIAIEIVLTSFFTLEYVLRIYAAPRPLGYVLSFFGMIDLLSVLPFYLGLIGTQYVRVFRVARLIRLLKISHIEAAAVSGKDDKIRDEVGLFPGESIEHIVARHPLFLFFGLVPPLVATCAALFVFLIFPSNPISTSLGATLLLFAIIFLWKAWLDYRYDVIYVTNKRLIFQNRHLLGRNTNQISFRAILNVKPRHNGIMSYVLGFGSIIIETAAAEEGRIEHRLVRKHEEGAKIIMQKSLTERGTPQEHGPTSGQRVDSGGRPRDQ